MKCDGISCRALFITSAIILGFVIICGMRVQYSQGALNDLKVSINNFEDELNKYIEYQSITNEELEVFRTEINQMEEILR